MLALTALSGCADPSFDLAHDAQLVKLSGATWAVTSSEGDFVVYPHVAGLTCEGRWAYGVRKRSDDNSFETPEFTNGLGYFLLDLQTNTVRGGLHEDQLRRELERLEIEFDEPHMVTSFERNFSGCV